VEEWCHFHLEIESDPCILWEACHLSVLLDGKLNFNLLAWYEALCCVWLYSVFAECCGRRKIGISWEQGGFARSKTGLSEKGRKGKCL